MADTHIHHHAKPAPGNNLVTDPVCGMSVDPHTAKHRADYAGRPYYFCSAGCRTKFLADPERYLASKEGELPAPACTRGNDLHLSDASRDQASSVLEAARSAAWRLNLSW